MVVRSVTVSEYWAMRLEAWVKTKVRKSKAEIVEEGLKLVAPRIEREAAEWEDFKDSHGAAQE